MALELLEQIVPIRRRIRKLGALDVARRQRRWRLADEGPGIGRRPFSIATIRSRPGPSAPLSRMRSYSRITVTSEKHSQG